MKIYWSVTSSAIGTCDDSILDGDRRVVNDDEEEEGFVVSRNRVWKAELVGLKRKTFFEERARGR